MGIEHFIEKCPYCHGPVIANWVVGGGILSDPSYVLVADWLFHTECWDKQVAENPTDDSAQST